MTRLTRISSFVALLLSFYVALWQDFLSIPGLRRDLLERMLPWLPLLPIFLLGLYCIFELISGVATMGDAKEAYTEILKDVDDARADLREKGVDVE